MMAVFKTSDSLKSGEVDFRIFIILGIQRPPEGGAALVALFPLGYGVEVPSIPLILVPILSLGDGVGVSLIPL